VALALVTYLPGISLFLVEAVRGGGSP
jgi:hypothetical protein